MTCNHPDALDGATCPDCGEITPLPAPEDIDDDDIDVDVEVFDQ